jgi:hypothetical protein
MKVTANQQRAMFHEYVRKLASMDELTMYREMRDDLRRRERESSKHLSGGGLVAATYFGFIVLMILMDVLG